MPLFVRGNLLLVVLINVIIVSFLAYGTVYAFSKGGKASEASKEVLAAVSESSPTEASTPTLTPEPTNTPIPTSIPTPKPTETPTPIAPSPTPTQTSTPTPEQESANVSNDIWEKLAHCESGDNWNIISPNGLYYGGLQFSLGAWASVGGQGLPSDASKEEQIERGKMLQVARGWSVWGECAVQLGLTT